MKRREHPFARQFVAPARRAPTLATQAMLAGALCHHRAGRFTDAEGMYRQILAIDPQHSDSLHLLGMIAYQAGRYDDAIEAIREAIAINPAQAAYHSNLGTIYHAQGNLHEAELCYAHALTLQPDLAITHYNLGTVLQAQNKLEAAAICYAQALALQPNLCEAHYNLGNVFQAQGKLDDAAASYRQALALEPGKHEARHNLGNALQSQDKLEEAMACYEQVLVEKPDYAKAHFSLGTVLHAMGRLAEASARYRTALELQPDFAEAAFSESLAQLLRGEFTPGWRNYEKRWQTEEHTPPMRAYQQPLWRGEKLADGRLLIWGEQGIGDEIMFAGMIPDVVRTGNRCILDCDPRLKPLFARSFAGMNVEVVSSHASGDDARCGPELQLAEPQLTEPQLAEPQFAEPQLTEPQFAAHLPSGSLPGLFRATSAAFAATASPYLIADAAEREAFRTRYADGRLLVGLAWHTNNRKTGRIRSIDLSLLGPLFASRLASSSAPSSAPSSAQPEIRWVSLQYGNHDFLQSQAQAAGAPLLIDRSVDQFADVDRFAAQVASMDLVITIDNSTAHLAGALGVPTWVLLPFVPDWRWLQERVDSPWYPALRLFRQPRRGDWQAVVQSVKSGLCARP
jgi:tetratricopeptide (TPR) repeat protein